ncbi:MAG TPA: chromate transporter, partial [Pirellulaceae bacterium]|nr:chromate transporter [Pirellulaceae bacterium]
ILFTDLIARGWATERPFAEALIIGQITPGPTGLWVISFGYLIDGVPGALMAAVAIAIPPLAVLLVAVLYQRHGDHPAMSGFIRGLSLAVVGIFAVVLVDILRGNGLGAGALLIAAAALGLALTNRIPVIAIIGLAAVAGMIIYR